jgi:hypothetical protein
LPKNEADTSYFIPSLKPLLVSSIRNRGSLSTFAMNSSNDVISISVDAVTGAPGIKEPEGAIAAKLPPFPPVALSLPVSDVNAPPAPVADGSEMSAPEFQGGKEEECTATFKPVVRLFF